MTATLAALVLAHLLADFMLQTEAMVARKREAGPFALHIALVFGTAAAALGGGWTAAAAIAGAHLAIDAVKTWAVPDAHREGLPAFLTDQAAHAASIVAVAWWAPDTFAAGAWAAAPPQLLGGYVLAGGLVLATLAGAPAIRALMVPYAEGAPEGTLPNAGRAIGLLERAMIYLMVMLGEPTGIGFLIAAKSVLRFEAAGKTRNAEYVIIGTLASFAWAIATALATQEALRHLPP